MKTMTMKALSLLLLLLNIVYCQAQVIPQEFSDIVNNADYIFEGTVIRSDSYWGVQNRTIYTSHTLEIHKIFKGNLTCGTIEVITEGGQVGDIALSISHNLELERGAKGLFACTNIKYYETPLIDYYPETNTDAVEVLYSEQGYFRYFDDSVNRAAANLFYNFDSLAQVYDAVALLTQLSYTECDLALSLQKMNHSSIAKFANLSITNTENEARKKRKAEILASKKALQNPSSVSKTLTSMITYSFENVVMTGTNPKYLEFDIYLKADDNSSYLDNAEVYIKYDNDSFGPSVVTNGKITVTRGTMLASTSDYIDPAITISDYGFDTIDITMNAYSNPPGRYPITTTPTQAVHVKMEYADCTVNSTIYFENTFFMLGASLYTSAPAAPTNANVSFATIDATDVENVPNCSPIITSFSPASLNAGVGDILTIHGKNFGVTQGIGRIFLPNANDGGLTYTMLDRKDSIMWSDTLLRVYVPSAKDTLISPATGNNSRSNPAGTGLIKLKTNNGTIISTSNLAQPTLYIGYSYINFIKNPQSQKQRISLVDAYGPTVGGNGGYIFKTKLKPQARLITGKAINDWVCLTHVHFELGDTLVNWQKNIAVYDSVNVIQFGNLPFGVLARTELFTIQCSGSTDPVVLEIDLIIKDTASLQYALSDTIPLYWGKYDFYEIILHELGHAHGLGHVIHDSTTSIMYYNATLGPLASANRKIHLVNDNNCNLGGNAVVSHSQTTPHNNCYNAINMQLLNAVNCAPNAIDNSNFVAENLILYPNPTTDKLLLEIPKYSTQLQSVEMFDITGKLVLEENDINNPVQEINLSQIQNGVYLIKATFKNSIIIYRKVIKQ